MQSQRRPHCKNTHSNHTTHFFLSSQTKREANLLYCFVKTKQNLLKERHEKNVRDVDDEIAR